MAYAVIISLKQTLEPLLDSSRSRIQIPNSELKLIYDDLCYAKSFFDKVNTLEDSNSVEELEKEIKDVAQNIQDLIEFHLSDLVDSGSESLISVFSAELVEVKEKLGSIIEVLKTKEHDLTGEQQQSGARFGSNNAIVRLADVDGSSSINFGNDELVGLDDELLFLLDRLSGGESNRQVISIVGMGGIGKTTLAKAAYLHPLCSHHFDVCLFVEIDVEFELKEVLLRLLGQLVSKGMEEETVDELGSYLYQHLLRRRYLVVLDDIFHIEARDELRRFLPDDRNGSRIILTSRIATIAVATGEGSIIKKRFLNNEESWELLRKMAFSDMEECPLELEKIGRKIMESLGGLPLGIVMIGKLLSKSERSPQNWMAVAQNIDSSVQETTIPTFMKLSYTQLPQRLKACFLYLGLFPPNYNIPAAQLIKLWVAEGFIESVAHKSLEQKAEEYLLDLVSRSLVIVHELGSTGRIKTCRIHPLLQDFCVSEARQEKLFHIVKEGTTSSRAGTKHQRRLGIQLNDDVPGVMEPVSRVRSLVFICPQHQHQLQLQVLLGCRWLRVLHAVSVRFREFPDEVVKLVRLRYLAITCDGELPPSISKLRSIEVLIIHPTHTLTINSSVFLPIEIWQLHKLRHLQCMGFDLPDPSAAATGYGTDLFLNKLQTLSGVSVRTCIEGVLARMPNLIKLGIRLESTESSLEMSCFDAVYTNLRLLESFKYRGIHTEAAFSLTGFPSGLRKLTLSGCGFLWDQHMAIVSWLPMLEVLKLQWGAFCGHVWELCDEGTFGSLKFLVLEGLDMEHLIMADYYHFPRLEQIHFRRCYKLDEIPSEIGEIATLRVIVVDHCSESLIESARRIKEEQEEIGNEDLQVRINGEEIMTSSYDTHAGSIDVSKLEQKSEITGEVDSTSKTEMASADGPYGTDHELEIPLTTISQLQEDEKSGEFWVFATISSLESVKSWPYLACKLCLTELELRPPSYDFCCDKCNCRDIGGRERYYLVLKATDATGTASFHLWDRQFLKLISETTYELNEAEELEELPTEIQSLNDKTALFKVLVEEGQTKDFRGAYRVTKVISDPDEINKYL